MEYPNSISVKIKDQRTNCGGKMYYIISQVWAHEKVHKNDFYDRIKEVLNYKFYNNNGAFTYREWLTTGYLPECNEPGNTKSRAIYQVKKHYDLMLKKFFIRLENKQNEFAHKVDEYIHRKHEEDRQEKNMVQWKITQYKTEFQKRSDEYWENCEFKEETD